MTKNILVHGDYKKLRENIRRYKKEEQRLSPKLLAYAKEKTVPNARLVGLPALHFLAREVLSDQTADNAGTREKPPRPNQKLSLK